MERRLAAILAADMVDYSRLMSGDETGTIARQNAHRSALVDPKNAQHGGRIVKTTRDVLKCRSLMRIPNPSLSAR